MVAKVQEITDAASAGHYYEQVDDYYTEHGAAPSGYHGRGASALGLDGEVDPGEFVALLKGELPTGQRLGTTRHRAHQHAPGWDLTMSAPKSVSTLALVAGDRRLIDAHDRAVQVALDYAERHAAATRIRRPDRRIDHVATGTLTIVQFRHVTARATESGVPAPQLHTHNVVGNMTRDEDGQWRSLDSRPLYRLQMAIGAVYHQELAAEARQLGYSVTVARDGTFEIDGVPDDVRRAFSERAAQIEAGLAARGKTRATASAAEKNVIALATRAPKRHVEHATLAATWRAEADALGFDEHTRRAIVTQAEARAAGTGPVSEARRAAADQAVAFATASISERNATFSAAALEHAAAIAARGRATHADVVAAIGRAEHAQALVIRPAPRMPQGSIGFATHEAVATEQHMLALERQGRGKLERLHTRPEAAAIVEAARIRAADHGHSWTEGQKDATQGLLMSRATVTAVQGHAGTAKTTTVLATYAEAARDQGLTVRALAPTATAAELLGRAVDAEHMTVAKLLIGGGEEVEHGREVWIVDEASMLAARDAEQLLARARDAGARLVLVGDVRQLGSVGAGRAFAQLQEHEMETFKLDEIVRQTNEHTREAVEAILAGEAARAFDAIDKGGGRIVEHAEDDIRHAYIARDFAKLSPEERAATLVLDPTREGRQRLTDAIRLALRKDGTLGDDAVVASVLEPCGLTKAEASNAASYTPGTIVTFHKGNREQRLSRGRAYRVEGIDADAGTVSLLSPQGRTVIWSPARWGGDQAEAYTEIEAEFRSGDQVQFTRNNKRAGRNNGDVATVVAVEPQGASLMVEKADGERQMVDMVKLADRHVRHGWVRTIHSAQGATADRVMAHLE